MRTTQTFTPEENEERAAALGKYKLYTLEECEPILGVKKRTLLEYARSGKLKAVKAGGKWKVSEDALKEFTSREG